MAIGMYELIKRSGELYSLLQDELSKEIFHARLKCDIDSSEANAEELASLNEFPEDVRRLQSGLEEFRELSRDKKIVLYGTGSNGRTCAGYLRDEGIDFYGFCGRRAPAFPEGLLGKPVFSPEYVFENKEELYVQIASSDYYDEIMGILKENDFPEDHIVTSLDFLWSPDGFLYNNQYFDFMEYFPAGTAFVDGGSYNTHMSYLFSQKVDGNYSKIFAFEPDAENLERCSRMQALHPVRDLEIVPKALMDHTGEISFNASGNGSSCVAGEQDGEFQRLPAAAIDDVVGAEKIGMIKMDIEGAELPALQGAENTIVRDHPLLAICVYHKPGDVLALMDYLNRIVPEYRFALRHYSHCLLETVLYAFIP